MMFNLVVSIAGGVVEKRSLGRSLAGKVVGICGETGEVAFSRMIIARRVRLKAPWPLADQPWQNLR